MTVSTKNLVPTTDVCFVQCTGPGFITPESIPMRRVNNKRNSLAPCCAYQALYKTSDSELIIYAHDDLTIHDQLWLPMVQEPFNDSRVAVVGLGGATRLGNPDIYKRAYRLQDMARGGYCSNQTDWQTHGTHETGAKRVAVVDAFFMAVRRSFLSQVGGWPTNELTHHCLDLWLACEAARRGYETWMVGVSCTHHGGGTSTNPMYRSAKWLKGDSLETDHQEPHRWLYETYRDVLPIEV